MISGRLLFGNVLIYGYFTIILKAFLRKKKKSIKLGQTHDEAPNAPHPLSSFQMAVTVHHVCSHLSSFHPVRAWLPTRPNSRKFNANSFRCDGSIETQRVTLKSGNDFLEICRVLNGMWQTSGGWGRIDRDDAVEAMLRHADAGLSTFDMADHCTALLLSTLVSVFLFLNSIRSGSIYVELKSLNRKIFIFFFSL